MWKSRCLSCGDAVILFCYVFSSILNFFFLFLCFLYTDETKKVGYCHTSVGDVSVLSGLFTESFLIFIHHDFVDVFWDSTGRFDGNSVV